MSQIEGAFVQGLGLYTLEELKYSPEGVLYTRGPHQYKIASVSDIPEEFHVSLLTPTQNPKAIYSSKVSIYGQASKVSIYGNADASQLQDWRMVTVCNVQKP